MALWQSLDLLNDRGETVNLKREIAILQSNISRILVKVDMD